MEHSRSRVGGFGGLAQHQAHDAKSSGDSADSITYLASNARDQLVKLEAGINALGERLQGVGLGTLGATNSAAPVANNVRDDLVSARSIISRCQELVGELHRLIG